MFKRIEEILKNTRPQGLSEEESSAMWSKIEQGIETQPMFSSSHLHIVSILKRFVLVPVLALSLLGGSTIAFADNARPGDFLFALDELAENIQISISSTGRRAELRIQFAEERFEEAQSILADYASSTSVSIQTYSFDDTDDDSATSTDETSGNDDGDNGTASTTDEASTSSESETAIENELAGDDSTINNLLGYLRPQVFVTSNEQRIARTLHLPDPCIPF